MCGPDDPDSAQETIHLSEDDAHSLVEALDVMSIDESAAARTYEVEGLVFGWLDVEAGLRGGSVNR